MIVIQFLEYLFHYSLSEQHCLRTHTDLVTVLLYGSHLTVIQIDDLSVPAYQLLLLFLEVLGIHTLHGIFLLLCQIFTY